MENLYANCVWSVTDFLCKKFSFEPDSTMRAICAVFSHNGGMCDCTPEKCPGILVFLGAYFDGLGLDGENLRRCMVELQNGAEKNPMSESADNAASNIEASCGRTKMRDVLLRTVDYLSQKTSGLNVKKEEAPDEPGEYYREIYNDREQMFFHTPYALEEKLINAVLLGDEAGAVFALREINRAGSKAVLASDSLRSSKNSVICTCVFLARASIRAGAAPDSAFALSDTVIRKIEEFQAEAETLQYEEDILLQFIKLVNRSRTKGFTRSVHRAIHYIDAHLGKKIKLADVAKYAGVSPGYLSGIFSREMNMPVSEYTLMRKVQESSYFVRHKEHSIADIANLYGFSGQSYYISIFRRFMGMTPGEYRKNIH